MHSLIVIGAGAAGMFAAIHLAERGVPVLILEKSPRILSKVRISGGGRCNVTHKPLPLSEMVKNYPRGGKKLKKVFSKWSSADTMAWFETRGVALKTEDDGRVFPMSDDSEEIVRVLEKAAMKTGVKIRLKCGVKKVEVASNKGYKLTTDSEEELFCEKLVIATGGSPTMKGFDMLRPLDLKIVPPVPSLFTFNIKDKILRENMGISVSDAAVHIPALKMHYEGPLLITHWGISGPAVLKLSAFAARALARMNHHFDVRVNWLPREQHQTLVESWDGNKKAANSNPSGIPKRLWLYLLNKADIDVEKTFREIGKKNQNRLAELLLNDTYRVEGKTTFKEEFVTAGGVCLSEINLENFEALRYPNLYLLGEVTDIDAITGGFNFQAAWAAGYLCGSKALG
jgi:predicted Rossmann fold flavoprotein